jgi:hypothetical protein
MDTAARVWLDKLRWCHLLCMIFSTAFKLCFTILYFSSTLVQWGEGSGGGWFRVQRGVNALALEQSACSWAVPAAADVQRALQQHAESVAQ